VTRDELVAYIGAVLAIAVAGSFVVRGHYPQASLLAAGAAFLIYWARQNRDRGDR
jgi:hypothetical protein